MSVSSRHFTKRTALTVRRAPDRTPFFTRHAALVEASLILSDEPEEGLRPGRPRLADNREPTSTLETALGRVYVRSRRYEYADRVHVADGTAPLVSGLRVEAVTSYRYEVDVTTEAEIDRAKAEGRRPRPIHLDDTVAGVPAWGSHLEAHLWALDWVEAAVARAVRRAVDRAVDHVFAPRPEAPRPEWPKTSRRGGGAAFGEVPS